MGFRRALGVVGRKLSGVSLTPALSAGMIVEFSET
jgi:hypothetical protein